jgi:hypothetical protein
MSIVCLSSCKKDEFRKDDITETDVWGTFIGNVDKRDWKIQTLKEFDEKDQSIFLNHILNTRTFEILADWNIKTHCDVDNLFFDLRVFPNKTYKNTNIKFRLKTDLEYILILTATVDKRGRLYTTGGGLEFWDELNVRQAADNRDFSVYYVVIDKDTCAYFGKGDVIVD